MEKFWYTKSPVHWTSLGTTALLDLFYLPASTHRLLPPHPWLTHLESAVLTSRSKGTQIITKTHVYKQKFWLKNLDQRGENWYCVQVTMYVLGDVYKWRRRFTLPLVLCQDCPFANVRPANQTPKRKTKLPLIAHIALQDALHAIKASRPRRVFAHVMCSVGPMFIFSLCCETPDISSPDLLRVSGTGTRWRRRQDIKGDQAIVHNVLDA